MTTIKEMPGLLNISFATWDRSKKAGDRPAVTQLSARRIGYRVDHIRSWLDGKRRSVAQ